MKTRILVADRDASLKEAFQVIFSGDRYEVLYASSPKEVEKLAEDFDPDVYMVNVSLNRGSGIEVYKALQKEKFLARAHFYFLKDEGDATELLGYEAAGVIEKPINFFKVYEFVSREDDVIELTDEVEQREAAEEEPQKEAAEEVMEAPEAVGAPLQVETPETPAASTEVRGDDLLGDEAKLEALSMLGAKSKGDHGTEAALPEDEIRTILTDVVEEAAARLAERMTPVLSRYMEEYTKRVLYQVAEKVIREEIDKLLKEATS